MTKRNRKTCAARGCSKRFTPNTRGRPRQHCSDACRIRAHREKNAKPALRYLSLGAGVQSTAVALLAAAGVIDRPKVAIFADTGWEPEAVYRHLDWLTSVLPFPVHRVEAGNLRLETWRREGFLRVPAFTKDADGKRGITRRQCTREYKIVPIQREARRILGIKPRYPVPPHIYAQALVGISTDEAHRMKPARERWVVKTYPLIDLGMSRADCLGWMADHGYPEPPRSACVGCPFHSDEEWKHLKVTSPGSFAEAVAIDAHIRDSTSAGAERPVYLHSSLLPLGEVQFGTDKTGHWGNECEGLCGN